MHPPLRVHLTSSFPFSHDRTTHLLIRADRSRAYHTPPDGAPLLLSKPYTLGDPLHFVTLRPRGTQTLTLPVRLGLAPGPFFRDYRLSPPGEYHLSLRLDRYPEEGMPDDARLTFLGPIVTSEAVVERMTPAASMRKCGVGCRKPQVDGGRRQH